MSDTRTSAAITRVRERCGMSDLTDAQIDAATRIVLNHMYDAHPQDIEALVIAYRPVMRRAIAAALECTA